MMGLGRSFGVQGHLLQVRTCACVRTCVCALGTLMPWACCRAAARARHAVQQGVHVRACAGAHMHPQCGNDRKHARLCRTRVPRAALTCRSSKPELLPPLPLPARAGGLRRRLPRPPCRASCCSVHLWTAYRCAPPPLCRAQGAAQCSLRRIRRCACWGEVKGEVGHP